MTEPFSYLIYIFCEFMLISENEIYVWKGFLFNFIMNKAREICYGMFPFFILEHSDLFKFAFNIYSLIRTVLNLKTSENNFKTLKNNFYKSQSCNTLNFYCSLPLDWR